MPESIGVAGRTDDYLYSSTVHGNTGSVPSCQLPGGCTGTAPTSRVIAKVHRDDRSPQAGHQVHHASGDGGVEPVGLDTGDHGAQSRGMAKSWLCRIGNHHWLRKEDEQGAQYLECERCGKRSEPEAGPLIGPDSTPLG